MATGKVKSGYVRLFSLVNLIKLGICKFGNFALLEKKRISWLRIFLLGYSDDKLVCSPNDRVIHRKTAEFSPKTGCSKFKV